VLSWANGISSEPFEEGASRGAKVGHKFAPPTAPATGPSLPIILVRRDPRSPLSLNLQSRMFRCRNCHPRAFGPLDAQIQVQAPEGARVWRLRWPRPSCAHAITEKGLRLATPEESPPKYARAGQDAGTPQPALASRKGWPLATSLRRRLAAPPSLVFLAAGRFSGLNSSFTPSAVRSKLGFF
jgi:hypothetical protein